MKKLLTLLLTLATSIQLFANAEIVIYEDATGTTVTTSNTMTIKKGNFNGFLEVGDKVIVTVTSYTGSGAYFQMGYANWTNAPTIATGDVEIIVAEADINKMNESGTYVMNFSTSTDSYTITKVKIQKNDSYSDFVELTCNEKATESNEVKAKLFYTNCANISDGDIIVVQTTENTHSNVAYHIQNLNGWSSYSNGDGNFDGRDFAYIVPSGVGSIMRTKTGTNDWDNGIVFKGGTTTDWLVSKVYLAKKIYSLNESSTPDFSSILQSSPINVKLTRTLKSGWNTICLPFALTSEQITTCFGTNAEAYEYTSRSSSTLTLTKVSEMTAGKPYMLNLGAATSSITFTNVSVTATTAGTGTTEGDLTFRGNFTPSMSMSGNYGLVNGSPSSIKKGGSSSTLPAFAAYFTGTPSLSAPSRGFSIEVGDGTTGIDAMERVVEEDNSPTYNLMGQQTTTPRKGIYIKNGKKYIAK